MIKEYVKKFGQKSIISSIIMIIMALFLMLKPIKTLNAIMITLGIIITIVGVLSLISYFRLNSQLKIFSFGLIEGILEIIGGILIILNPSVMTSFLPIIIGVWIILKNLIACQFAINLKSLTNNWIFLLIIAILSIILGVLIAVNPFSATLAITLIAGVMLLITETFNLFEAIYLLIRLK